MPDDRVNVAGVWMSRQEAAELEAERQRLFGTRGSTSILRHLAIGLGLGIPLYFAMLVTLFALNPGVHHCRRLWEAAPFGAALAASFLFRHMVRREQGRQSRAAMNRLGRRVCVKCAYEIAIDSPYGEVCPECGAPFKEPAKHA